MDGYYLVPRGQAPPQALVPAQGQPQGQHQQTFRFAAVQGASVQGLQPAANIQPQPQIDYVQYANQSFMDRCSTPFYPPAPAPPPPPANPVPGIGLIIPHPPQDNRVQTQDYNRNSNNSNQRNAPSDPSFAQRMDRLELKLEQFVDFVTKRKDDSNKESLDTNDAKWEADRRHEEREKIEAERREREEYEARRREWERRDKDRREREREEETMRERERQDRDRRERDRQDHERRERERKAEERRERDRQDEERRERERQDEERRERDRQDQERRERDRQDKERREQERQNEERRHRERVEEERRESARRQSEKKQQQKQKPVEQVAPIRKQSASIEEDQDNISSTVNSLLTLTALNDDTVNGHNPDDFNDSDTFEPPVYEDFKNDLTEHSSLLTTPLVTPSVTPVSSGTRRTRRSTPKPQSKLFSFLMLMCVTASFEPSKYYKFFFLFLCHNYFFL